MTDEVNVSMTVTVNGETYAKLLRMGIEDDLDPGDVAGIFLEVNLEDNNG